MQYFDIKTFKNNIFGNKKPVFFFDFDGTLVDITIKHQTTCLDKKTHDLLTVLSEKYFVAILTGRSLEDIMKIAPVSNLTYAGNHGLEIHSVYQNKWQHPDIPLEQLQSIYKKLIAAFVNIEGIYVENKKLSLSVHYREAKEISSDLVYQIVNDLCHDQNKLLISHGKMVVNICPNINWDKGQALNKLMRDYDLEHYFPVFCGDDINDEPAFDQVNDHHGISIYIGQEEHKTQAQFFLETPKDVIAMLTQLAIH